MVNIVFLAVAILVSIIIYTFSIIKNNQKRSNIVFRDEHYNSKDGMMTAIWGPPMWHFLHTMSFNYPIVPSPDDMKNYREFVYSLQNVLPCRYCRENFKD